MTIKRVDISTLVPSQVPEFVRTDYQTFLTFMEAYYDFLKAEEVVVDIAEVTDIDTSVDKYLQHLKSEIAPSIPFDIANNRFKASRLKDLYDSKGSSASFKLLFRLLYNKETDIEFPSQQMLIPSDGRWKQPSSIFVTFDTALGDPADLRDKILSIKGSGTVIEVFVERVEPVVVLDVNGNLVVDANTFQLFISRDYFGVIAQGNTATHISEGLSFTGKIVASSTKIKILGGGKGFKVGEIYNITTNTGYGAQLKVNTVGTLGEILSAELISAGIHYATSFTTSLFAKKFSDSVPAAPFTISFGGGTYSVAIQDNLEPLIDYGFISKYDYTVSPYDYVSQDYVGGVVQSFYDVGAAAAVDLSNSASVEVTTGPLVKYPGYFASNAGFLSDALYLQDSHYYQTFSYVVKLDQTLDSYAGVLKSLLHPAGTALFGEFSIRDELSFESFGLESNRSGILRFDESVAIADTIT